MCLGIDGLIKNKGISGPAGGWKNMIKEQV
jgi:hypothetical protein